MSLPSFPDTDQLLSREEVINQIISSIAMEELGLSHLINAEGEKLQYALGTIPGVTGPGPLTMNELLELNKSIHKTLDSTMMNQFFLKEKLISALSAAVMLGPTGPAGLSPTVEVGNTETIEPGLSADVSATPTAAGIELNFRIPRGATGAVEASGIQVVLDNAGSREVEIPQDGVIPFNQVLSSGGTDISYDSSTSIFTINTTGLNHLYIINWWIMVEGSDSAQPVTLALNVGGTLHLTAAPWVETQLSGSTLAVVGENPIQVSLINATGSTVNLPNVGVQAQINIIGFSRRN